MRLPTNIFYEMIHRNFIINNNLLSEDATFEMYSDPSFTTSIDLIYRKDANFDWIEPTIYLKVISGNQKNTRYYAITLLKCPECLIWKSATESCESLPDEPIPVTPFVCWSNWEKTEIGMKGGLPGITYRVQLNGADAVPSTLLGGGPDSFYRASSFGQITSGQLFLGDDPVPLVAGDPNPFTEPGYCLGVCPPWAVYFPGYQYTTDARYAGIGYADYEKNRNCVCDEAKGWIPMAPTPADSRTTELANAPPDGPPSIPFPPLGTSYSVNDLPPGAISCRCDIGYDTSGYAVLRDTDAPIDLPTPYPLQGMPPACKLGNPAYNPAKCKCNIIDFKFDACWSKSDQTAVRLTPLEWDYGHPQFNIWLIQMWARGILAPSPGVLNDAINNPIFFPQPSEVGGVYTPIPAYATFSDVVNSISLYLQTMVFHNLKTHEPALHTSPVDWCGDVECPPNGPPWNSVTKTCACPVDQTWNGEKCGWSN